MYGEWGERVLVFMGSGESGLYCLWGVGRAGSSVYGEWGEGVIVFMGSGESWL